MAPKGTALLIHGAWQGSWVWAAHLAPLRAAGWEPVALDLPGNGADNRPPETITFADHLAHALSALHTTPGPTTLIAHSGGGVLATALAEAAPERIAGILHVAGMRLPSGITFAEFLTPFTAANPAAIGIGAHLHKLPHATRVPEAAALRIFYHDCPPEPARAAAARLTPQPDGVRAPRVTHTPARAGRVPAAYIHCGRDRSVLPAVQDAMAEGLPTLRLDTGHAPMLAAPQALAEALTTLLDSFV